MRAPLSCDFVDRHAVRYFFAGVPAAVQTGMNRHFAVCPCCRRKVQVFRRIWRWDGRRRAAKEVGLSIADDTATMSDLSA